jgi:hypothetical protein
MNFSRDRRGQSVVIGTVVLFGFLIAALSLYQVQVVPQQNGQVEFQHSEQVRNDLVDLRAGILQAGSTERAQYQTVRLGTEYPPRVLGINPPAPAGTLRTSDSYPINITYANNDTLIESIPTRFVEYRPGYNEIARSSTWIDSSVLYVDARDDGDGVAIIEEQQLVVNDTLRVVAVQNEFQTSRTGRVSLELYLKENLDESANLSGFDGPVNVSIPTRLDDDYWSESIQNGSVTYNGVNTSAFPDADDPYVSALELQVDSLDNATVNSVGVQSEPSEGAVKANVGPAEGGSGGDTLPPGVVAYDDANGDGSYTVGVDTPYAESDFDNGNGGGAQGDFQGENIILLEDISVGELDLQANSFTARSARIETTANDLKLQTSSGGIDLGGSTLKATTGSEIDIQAATGSTIDIRDSLLISNKEITAQADSGELRFNNPGTRIEEKNGGGQTLKLSSGTKNGENGVSQPETGTITAD